MSVNSFFKLFTAKMFYKTLNFFSDVDIPKDAEVVQLEGSTTIYRTNKIIIKNPRKVDDDLALRFYDRIDDHGGGEALCWHAQLLDRWRYRDLHRYRR